MYIIILHVYNTYREKHMYIDIHIYL